MSTLQLHAVSKAYGAISAVLNVDLEVAAGSRTAIVGPSGSGKSTLLRLIAGFESLDSGRIALNGKIIADDHGEIPAHKRVIGFVPQDGALFPHLNVAANVGFGLAKNSPERMRRIAELMDMVTLDQSLLTRWPHELSGGQQQRVALARALAQRPQLMLLDEPFSALDTGLRSATRRAVAQLLSDAGVTTILVTHDQAEALSFADQLAVMRAGQLVQVGRPMDLYLRPSDEATALFLGDALVLPAMLDGAWAECALGSVAIDVSGTGEQARIMLRLEQLHVTEVDQNSVSGPDCIGFVIETDFSGASCLVTLRLAAPALLDLSAAQIVHVRCAGLDAPAVGAAVRITVSGHAHVLPA